MLHQNQPEPCFRRKCKTSWNPVIYNVMWRRSAISKSVYFDTHGPLKIVNTNPKLDPQKHTPKTQTFTKHGTSWNQKRPQIDQFVARKRFLVALLFPPVAIYHHLTKDTSKISPKLPKYTLRTWTTQHVSAKSIHPSNLYHHHQIPSRWQETTPATTTTTTTTTTTVHTITPENLAT